MPTELSNFAAEYKNLVNRGKHSRLLANCMSRYPNDSNSDGTPKDDTECFRFDTDQDKLIDPKNSTEVIVNYSGGRIVPSDFDSSNVNYWDNDSGTLKSVITIADIANEETIGTGTNSKNFFQDWKDLRVAMGDIELNGDGNISSVTSDKIDLYKSQFKTDITDYHETLKRQRNNLDNKMRDLYAESDDADLNLDSSVYSTMLFTVLTTSLLYYLFIKI